MSPELPTTGAVLVTGAASGIGRATAARLHAAGRSVALVDRDVDALAATLDALGARVAPPGRAADGTAVTGADAPGRACLTAHVADVRDRAALDDVVLAAATHHDGIAGLVCAAGVLEAAPLRDITPEAWDRQLDVNTRGVLHALQAVEEHLEPGGAVVVVGSNASHVPRAGMAAYAASKAATAALVRCVGLELAARGVRCNVVEPGSTDTPMQRDLWPDEAVGRAAALDGDPATYRVGVPLGRIADPDDIAAVVAFLLSADARHVTLQRLAVDGGASL